MDSPFDDAFSNILSKVNEFTLNVNIKENYDESSTVNSWTSLYIVYKNSIMELMKVCDDCISKLGESVVNLKNDNNDDLVYVNMRKYNSMIKKIKKISNIYRRKNRDLDIAYETLKESYAKLGRLKTAFSKLYQSINNGQLALDRGKRMIIDISSLGRKVAEDAENLKIAMHAIYTDYNNSSLLEIVADLESLKLDMSSVFTTTAKEMILSELQDKVKTHQAKVLESSMPNLPPVSVDLVNMVKRKNFSVV